MLKIQQSFKDNQKNQSQRKSLNIKPTGEPVATSKEKRQNKNNER